MARLISDLDLFAAFARYGRERKTSLHDASALEEFSSHVKAEVAEALSNPIIVHGQRVQNMFEAMVVAFGGFRLLKVEDGGRYHPETNFEIPDFRLVLNDGQSLLVEVKNCYCDDPFKQVLRFKHDYIERMISYAAVAGGELRLAIYWARWGLWTLVAPTDLRTEGNYLTISMTDAMRVSEMARLGDVSIGLKAPLRFRMIADRSQARFVENGQANISISDVKLFCGENEIVHPDDKHLVWMLMQFGDWTTGPPTAIMDGDLVDALESEWKPEQPTDDQGFDFIGTASRVFSRYFALRTVGDGKVRQTEIEPVPDWLAPILSDRPHREELPIWKFYLQPNRTQE